MSEKKQTDKMSKDWLEGENLSVQVDEGMPDINPEKICFIIPRFKFEVQLPVTC